LKVEVKRIAVLVNLGLVRSLVAGTDALDAMLTECVTFESPEQVAQSLFADAAQSARSELEPPLFLIDESRFAERFGESGKPIE